MNNILSRVLPISILWTTGFTFTFASSGPASSLGYGQEGAAGTDWAVTGGTDRAWRYSSLRQINADNVKRLVPIWSYETGDYEDGLQSTPVVVEGIVYIYTASSHVVALDGATGRAIWEYKFEPPPGVTSAKRNNSGVAVSAGRVFLGTRSNYLIALDAKTGKEIWKLANGDITNGVSGIAGVPLVAGSLVIVGAGGPRGSITAYDAATGHLTWRFYTVPQAGGKGSETWPDEQSLKYGGGNVWTSGSYDAELDLVYWGVGDPRPTFYGSNRLGDNLYTASIVALNAHSGELVWYRQEIPHDTWDWDVSSESTLLDHPIDGRPRKLLVNLNKGGFAWVLDRQDGEVIGIYPFADYYNWVSGISQSGELRGRVDPVEGKKTLICPSNVGAKNWHQSSFSPLTGLLYVPVLEYCNEITSLGPTGTSEADRGSGSFVMKPIPGHDTGYSHLDAIDPFTGKRHWSLSYRFEFMAPTLATAGNLVFTGDVEGSYFALNAKTGRKLWSYQTGAFHRGGAVTYSIGGRQIIATPVGGSPSITASLWPEGPSWRMGSSIVAFSLPSTSK